MKNIVLNIFVSYLTTSITLGIIGIATLNTAVPLSTIVYAIKAYFTVLGFVCFTGFILTIIAVNALIIHLLTKNV